MHLLKVNPIVQLLYGVLEKYGIVTFIKTSYTYIYTILEGLTYISSYGKGASSIFGFKGGGGQMIPAARSEIIQMLRYGPAFTIDIRRLLNMLASKKFNASSFNAYITNNNFEKTFVNIGNHVHKMVRSNAIQQYYSQNTPLNRMIRIMALLKKRYGWTAKNYLFLSNLSLPAMHVKKSHHIPGFSIRAPKFSIGSRKKGGKTRRGKRRNQTRRNRL